jgi:hypothetical protein
VKKSPRTFFFFESSGFLNEVMSCLQALVAGGGKVQDGAHSIHIPMLYDLSI